MKLKSVLHLFHSKQDHKSIFNWIWNLISILTWSIFSFKYSNNSSHFLIKSSSPPIFINIHQIHLKLFNPSKSLSYSSNNSSRSEWFITFAISLAVLPYTHVKWKNWKIDLTSLSLKNGSALHQYLNNITFIVKWWSHERSPSILKKKSNLTIDDKRWGGR